METKEVFKAGRPRGRKSVPDTVIYQRISYRFDLGKPEEKETYEWLTCSSSKPSGPEIAMSLMTIHALREVLPPSTMKRIMNLSRDYLSSSEKERETHPLNTMMNLFINPAPLIAQMSEMGIFIKQEEPEEKPKRKRRTKRMEDLPAEENISSVPPLPISSEESFEKETSSIDDKNDDIFMDEDFIKMLGSTLNSCNSFVNSGDE